MDIVLVPLARAKAARFPLDLLVVAAVGLFSYGRGLGGCSSSSNAPQGSTRVTSIGGSTNAGHSLGR